MAEKEIDVVEETMKEVSNIMSEEVSEEVKNNDTTNSDCLNYMTKGVQRMFDAFVWFDKLSDEAVVEQFKYSKEEVISKIQNKSVDISQYDIIHAYENYITKIKNFKEQVKYYSKDFTVEEMIEFVQDTFNRTCEEDPNIVSVDK